MIDRFLPLAAALLLAAWSAPAAAADWRPVDPADTGLWYDAASLDSDEDNEGHYFYFALFEGAWAGAEAMTRGAVRVSFDCEAGDAYRWNAASGEWEFSPAFTEHKSLNKLAFDGCH